MKICSVDGCDRKFAARSFCLKHYTQNALHGDPLGYTYRPTLSERLWAKVDKSGECWLWDGAKSGGYGQLKNAGKNVGAHRVAYEEAHGPIPAGMVVDHRCHVKLCVRPEHLRVVTQKQNMENRQGAMRNNASTGVQGVHWDAQKGRYRAMVRHEGKRYYAGQFSTLAEAEAAVIAKRNELFTHNDLDRSAAA